MRFNPINQTTIVKIKRILIIQNSYENPLNQREPKDEGNDI
jgi:hypothetical protein